MAKQIGCKKMKGRIDDYSFYYDRLHGYLVRRTGGITSKEYQKDARYAGARAASSEFSAVSSAGKLIRDAFGAFALQVKDGTMVNRMNKELVALKQLDNKHSRGERTPVTRLADSDENKYLRIFQFNEGVKTYELTEGFPELKRHRDGLAMTNVKLLSSAFPEGASCVGLTMVRTVIDFQKKCFKTNSSRMTLVSRENPMEIALVIDEVPSAEGIEIVCLQLVFFEERNGSLLQLKGKVHGMGISGIKEIHATPSWFYKVQKVKYSAMNGEGIGLHIPCKILNFKGIAAPLNQKKKAGHLTWKIPLIRQVENKLELDYG